MADIDEFDLDSFDFGDFDSLETGFAANEPMTPTADISKIVTTVKKRAMVVIFVVDISGSMRGARIGAVNDAIRNVLPELKKRERGNTSAEIKVAILEFSTRANWRTLYPEPVSTFRYRDIENVGGGTNYGMAFEALDMKLTSNQFMSSSAGAYTPLIIFMTDGKPSDMGLYREKLDILKRNKWFRYATRAGIAIEEGALSPECKRVLLEFTENENNIYEAANTVILAKQIKLVTLTGVDFTTQQGSVQNSAPHTSSEAPATLAEQLPIAKPPVSSSASPTLPIGTVDWENDFYFD